VLPGFVDPGFPSSTQGCPGRLSPRTEPIVNTAAQRLQLLLVDDDPGDVLIVVEALHQLATPPMIHTAGDGLEALEFLRRQGRHAQAPRPDVILLDLNMPRLDGRGLLAAIKNDRELKQIPAVIWTTSSAPEDIAGSYEHYANAYVIKPADLDQLARALHQISRFFSEVAARPGGVGG
jgi:CheY-like chemotaxis protein